MKKILFFIAFSICIGNSFSQEQRAFKKGEWLRFKMNYSGFLKAGNATLAVDELNVEGKEVYHVTGKGWTTGVIKWFFKVNDNYQSYFDKKTGKPYLFKRKINEDGYKKHRNTTFNYTTNKAEIHDFLNQKDTTVAIGNVQDMMSLFYFLRSQDVRHLKPGDDIDVNLFIDSETTPFKLRLLGIEILKTAFGKVKTYRFRPFVQSGRIFKAQESVTMWITADDNKIPIKILANLSVGSLRAELDAYKGLANPFEIIYD